MFQNGQEGSHPLKVTVDQEDSAITVVLDVDTCVCYRMVKKAPKVTVDQEDVLTRKKEEEERYDYDAGQWTQGFSKGVYVHKVASLAAGLVAPPQLLLAL